MAAGGHSLQALRSEERRDLASQDVAPGAVEVARAPEVAVEAAGLDEEREGLLVQPGGPATAELLLLGQGVQQTVRRQDPADPDGRGERLADRPQGDDPFGGQALQGPDGLAVVAELG